MRYRKLDPNGDYTVDPGATFLVNSPETVGQAVRTRLKLMAGEWFLNKAEGLTLGRVLGNRTQGTRDQEIQQRILNTQGVKSIVQYVSQVDGNTRKFRAAAVIDTIYGLTTVAITEAL